MHIQHTAIPWPGSLWLKSQPVVHMCNRHTAGTSVHAQGHTQYKGHANHCEWVTQRSLRVTARSPFHPRKRQQDSCMKASQLTSHTPYTTCGKAKLLSLQCPWSPQLLSLNTYSKHGRALRVIWKLFCSSAPKDRAEIEWTLECLGRKHRQ